MQRLPDPIKRFFAPEATAACFADDAVVVDEKETHRGRPAIAAWSADAIAKYHHTTVPLSVESHGTETVVTARVTGTFPGSPVELRYRFTVAGDLITRLEVTP
ncbi:MAG TPA: nuclear transport factor 2 family protein [Kofleriaceae bacterium]|jgi:ketosteroid isomerase-like protein